MAQGLVHPYAALGRRLRVRKGEITAWFVVRRLTITLDPEYRIYAARQLGHIGIEWELASGECKSRNEAMQVLKRRQAEDAAEV